MPNFLHLVAKLVERLALNLKVHGCSVLSLASTGKHNDVESRGRGLPASAATLSRG